MGSPEKRNKNLSQYFEESFDKMFDTNFIDSVINTKECSSINDSMPFRYSYYVSRMYDSNMSRASELDEKNYKRETEFKKPKKTEEMGLGELIDMVFAQKNTKQPKP